MSADFLAFIGSVLLVGAPVLFFLSHHELLAQRRKRLGKPPPLFFGPERFRRLQPQDFDSRERIKLLVTQLLYVLAFFLGMHLIHAE